MGTRSKEDIARFLRNEKFYKDPNNFCLGNSLEEAGEITRIIMREVKEREKIAIINEIEDEDEE